MGQVRNYQGDRNPNYLHGHHSGGKKSTTYSIWSSMKDRCLNSKHRRYARYGGRGIRVCDRWLSFESFLLDMGERPKGLSLERIDNDGDYQPGNCRWATNQEQSLNRRSNRRLTFNGKTQTVKEWSLELGFKKNLIKDRLRIGWTVEQALTVPPGKKRRSANWDELPTPASRV